MLNFNLSPAQLALQKKAREFALQEQGFAAVKHQTFVGTQYFDYLQNTIQQGASTVAMAGSTEEEQFHA